MKTFPFRGEDFFERRDIPFLLRMAVTDLEPHYVKLAWRVLRK